MKKSSTITVSFAEPVTAPVLVPVKHNATPACINDTFMVNGTPYGVTAMSLGSPHAAVLVDDVDSVDVPALGSALGSHVLFPKGARCSTTVRSRPGSGSAGKAKRNSPPRARAWRAPPR